MSTYDAIHTALDRLKAKTRSFDAPEPAVSQPLHEQRLIISYRPFCGNTMRLYDGDTLAPIYDTQVLRSTKTVIFTNQQRWYDNPALEGAVLFDGPVTIEGELTHDPTLSLCVTGIDQTVRITCEYDMLLAADVLDSLPPARWTIKALIV